MKNLFYCSDTQNDIFPANTRTSFDSYIDDSDLNYIPDKHLLAALKSITFDIRNHTIKLNPEKPHIIIRQTDAAWSWQNMDGPQERIIGPTQFRFGRDYIYINDMKEKNDRYGTPGCRSFTDIQIVEHRRNDHGMMQVLHNIYLNDVILHSVT